MHWFVKMYVRLLCLLSYYWQYFVVRPMPMWKVPVHNSASLPLVGDNSLAHKSRVVAAVELHLNASYAQHLALESVYEKRQYKIMGGSHFPLGQCFN